MTNSTVNCQPDTLEAMLDAIEANLTTARQNVAETTEIITHMTDEAGQTLDRMAHAAQIEQQMHTARMRAEEQK